MVRFKLTRLQFGHGGEAVEDGNYGKEKVMLRKGFNSATAVKPWRTAIIWDNVLDT